MLASPLHQANYQPFGYLQCFAFLVIFASSKYFWIKSDLIINKSLASFRSFLLLIQDHSCEIEQHSAQIQNLNIMGSSNHLLHILGVGFKSNYGFHL